MEFEIKTNVCYGLAGLEYFLNDKLDYKGVRPENVILGITQYGDSYTVIYKQF